MNSAFLLSLTSVLFLHGANFVTSDQLEKPFTVEAPFDIKHLPDRIIQYSELGHVFGARDCAISGRIFEFRAEKCRTEVPAICSLLADKAIIASDGLSKSVEFPESVQKLQAGEPYLLRTAGAPTAELKGKFSIGRIEIVDSEDGQVKICVKADFFIWPNNLSVDESWK